MAGERVLLVEDNLANRRMAQFLLESRGFIVIEALTGEEAIQLARTERPDLIIMDLQLGGWTVSRPHERSSADSATRHIPIVAMTAYAMSGDRERGGRGGMRRLYYQAHRHEGISGDDVHDTLLPCTLA